MEGSQINASVLQRTHHHAALEGTIHDCFDSFEGGDVHLLNNGGQGDVGKLG